MRVICAHCNQLCRRRKDGTAGRHRQAEMDCPGIGTPGPAVPDALIGQHAFARRVMAVQEEYLRDRGVSTGPESDYQKIMHGYLVAMARVLREPVRRRDPRT